MQYEFVQFEEKGKIAYVTICREKALNALNEQVITELLDCFQNINRREDLGCVIVTGAGRSFIAGADIGTMRDLQGLKGREFTMFGQQLMDYVENMRIPVIAAINGFALGGGCELAMACDIRIASEKARMGLPETGLGVICGAGGTQRLPRIVGESRAKEMIFTAERMDARTALSIGLVDRVTSPESLLDETLALCSAIEKNGQLAVRAAKRAINAARDTDIRDGCRFEREIFSSLFDTEDQKTGMGGFLAGKKDIVFKNR